MKEVPSTVRMILGMVLLVGMVACAGPKEAGEEAPNRRERPEPPEATQDLDLQNPTDEVRSIQLYGDDEAALPILPLQSGRELTLEFDLMSNAGRPLSVYFYHADRTWERDLFASEYLTSFHRDDVFDYQPSRGTHTPYTHYTYTFPNQSIGFRISGNYILRITEQGREDAVLFERVFFVTEDAGPVSFGIDNVMVSGYNSPLAQPILSFSPPQALRGNVFDYNVCFIRNGQVGSARCSDEPSLGEQPALLFYLQPDRSFEPLGADYFLDISRLQVGGQVEQVDLTTDPFQMTLAPDYARFPASGTEPLLSGQSVISGAVRNVGDADTEGEYIDVGFSFVPEDEQPLPGGLFITGSFNGWSIDLGNELRWVPERGRYEGTHFIKQGQYEYRYTSPEPQVRRALRNPLPRPDNTYAAFVYYADASLNTDRLLAAQHIRAR